MQIDGSKAMRRTQSFTIDNSTLEYLERTRSHRSRSERVNELLHRAIRVEQDEALGKEAAEFYTGAGKRERAEARAFAQATRRSLSRESD